MNKKEPQHGLVWTRSLFSQAGLLTCGSFSDCTFPFPTGTVAFYSRRPRLQRWPNVTDLHRIPFSPPDFGGTWQICQTTGAIVPGSNKKVNCRSLGDGVQPQPTQATSHILSPSSSLFTSLPELSRYTSSLESKSNSGIFRSRHFNRKN